MSDSKAERNPIEVIRERVRQFAKDHGYTVNEEALDEAAQYAEEGVGKPSSSK